MKKILLTLSLLSCGALASNVVWNPNPPEQRVTSYNLYYTTGTNAHALLGTADGSATNWNLATNFAPGVYTFSVTASNAFGEGPAGFSQPVWLGVPTSAGGVTVIITNIITTTITVR